METSRRNNEGSKAHKSGDYPRAISMFTEAILKLEEVYKGGPTKLAGDKLAVHLQSLSMLHSNRSASYLLSGNVEKAIADARESIKHWPHKAKGHVRLGVALEKFGDIRGACEVYRNAIKTQAQPYDELVKNLVEANDRCHHFSQQFIDEVRFETGILNFCQVCQKTKDLFRCSACHCIYYCSQDHQRQDWSHHRTICKLIPDIVKEQKTISAFLSLSPDNMVGKFPLKKAFTSLKMKTWDEVFSYSELTPDDEVARKYTSQLLSWPLNMVAALQRFNFNTRSRLSVHVLGADDSYVTRGLFAQLLVIFPTPPIDIYLIGPDISSDFGPFDILQNTLRGVSTHYHTFCTYEDYQVPDMIYGCHPAFNNLSYLWRPTILRIIKQAIPAVFTAWNKEEFDRDMALLNSIPELMKPNIMFQGKTLFPSLTPSLNHKNNEIRIMNSYWYAFNGGHVVDKEKALELLAVIDDVPGRTADEILSLKYSFLDGF